MARRILLISDVDNTLLGDDLDLARFRAWYEQHRSDVRLIYNSGRFYESVVESVRTTFLPKPYAIIGGVGTELRFYPSGRPVFAWEEHLYNHWDADRVRDTLADFDRLERQPDEFQSDFKVSYYLRRASPQELEMILIDLRAASINADLIYSSQIDLDLVPAGFNKGSAAKFAADYFGYLPEEVVVCGDSANDLAMFNFGFRGVVVGNAHSELTALDSPLIYQSAHSFAAGVLDGLEHWVGQSIQQRRKLGRRAMMPLVYAAK